MIPLPILSTYGINIQGALVDELDKRLIFINKDEKQAMTNIEIKRISKRQIYRSVKFSKHNNVTYKYFTLHDHFTFIGDGVIPVLQDTKGNTCLAFQKAADSSFNILCGLDIEREIVRYSQGDEKRIDLDIPKSKYGFEFERPNYLFEHQIHPKKPSIPWVDNLGFLLAKMIAAILNIPLAHPVPYAKKGIIIVSGDDDQAQPISYFEQLNQLKDIPITYFMKNDTNLDKATFQKLPAGVDFAFHPDSLLEPEKYEINFKAQLKSVEKLIGKPMKTVRNHGYLNNGYLGHLNVWEENDFSLNLNIPGVDGTALNGSFLPLRIKRLDGTWSNHMSLLTTFGDGFIYAMGKSEKAFIKRIKKIVRQIENSIPGVLVFNLHPENNKKTRLVIDYLNEINSDSNWEFMSISEYLLWIEHLQRVTFERDSDGDTKLLNSKFDNRIRFYYSGFDLQKIKAKI